MAAGATTSDNLSQLMARIASGEREALRQLYQATSAKLFGVCMRILSNTDECEDVLQEVYLTIWRRADRYEAARAGVMAWMRPHVTTTKLPALLRPTQGI